MQTDTREGSELETLALQLERELMNSYGSPLLTGEKLAEAMGYRSIHSLRKHRGPGSGLALCLFC